MSKIKYSECLLNHDGAQIFSGHFVEHKTFEFCIGLNVCDNENGEHVYMIVGVEPKNYLPFSRGIKDLRSVIESRTDGKWYLFTGCPDGIIKAELQHGEIPEGYMPESGFYLPKMSDEEIADRQKKAIEKIIKLLEGPMYGFNFEAYLKEIRK